MGLAAIGTDTGGSVRIPAATCGVVGLKPSAGDVPLDGVIPLSVSLDCVGPLTSSVPDAALVYAVLADRAPIVIGSGSPMGLRLRRLHGYLNAPLDVTVRMDIERAVARLAAAGFTLCDGEIAHADRAPEVYTTIALSECAHWHARYLARASSQYTPAIRARLESARGISATSYLAALDARTMFRRAVDDALAGCDALVLPTLPVIAQPIGTETTVLDGHAVLLRAAMLKHTQLFNLSGHPAISLPVPATTLPVGLQLVGRVGDTAGLLHIAAACERYSTRG